MGLLLAGPLLLPLGHWLAVALLFLLALCVRYQSGLRTCLVRQDLAPAMMLIALAAMGVVSGLWHGGLMVALPVTLMAMGCLATLCGLRVLRPRVVWLWAGLALAGLGSGVSAGWQRWVDGDRRADGLLGINPILFGNLALLAGLLCLAGLIWAWQQPRRTCWLVLMVAGVLGGTLASALSGSRGGWLALPPAAVLVAVAVPRRAWRLWHVGIVPLVLLLLAGLYAWPDTGVQKRLDGALEELAAYRQGESYGSVGRRLAMHQGAVLLIVEHPVQGVGPAGFASAMQALVKAGLAPEDSDSFWHAHHDVLDAWVRHGLLGLIAVLAAYGLALWRFLPGLRATDPSRRALALAGTLLPVSFLAFGMSYSMLAFSLGVAVYGGWLALLWVLYGDTLESSHCSTPVAI